MPRAGVYDNEAALVHRQGGRPNLTEAFQRFRGTLGMGVIVCDPGDPEAKGLVERFNGYLETSFLPGRRFSSPEDFNAQLAEWLPRANRRVHQTLRCRPVDRLGEDRAAMMGFPPVLPAPGAADHHPPGPGPLGAGGDMRLLGAPQSGWPPGRDPGRSGRGDRHLRR